MLTFSEDSTADSAKGDASECAAGPQVNGTYPVGKKQGADCKECCKFDPVKPSDSQICNVRRSLTMPQPTCCIRCLQQFQHLVTSCRDTEPP